jgi:DNA-binding CsgD family transcriptional regulator
MAERKLLPWGKMWDLLSECGAAPDLCGMLQRAVEGLPRLISCENAIAVTMSFSPTIGRPEVRTQSNGTPEKALLAYREYYFYKDFLRESMDNTTLTYQMDWRQAKFSRTPIAHEFIRGLLGVVLTAGIPIYDADGMGGMNLCFTRIGKGWISSRDEAIMRALRPQIVNLYTLFKRIETLPADHLFAAELARESELLSKREAEIATFLCKRLHAYEIATVLMISKRTVETHIQHIYYKLHVNNRVELLHRLVG